MLDVILFESVDYFTRSHFDQRALFITPSPKVADTFRELVSDHYEVITISKWVSDYLEIKQLEKKNKSELFLELSSVWRNYFKDASYNLFYNSFEVFTDIRSYTLDLNLLSDFINELPADIKKSLMIFYAYFETEKIVDEHLAYQLMKEFEIRRDLYFVGFKHLSGIQLDMINELSKKVDVKIFIPQSVYLESVSTDWVRWLNVVSDKIDISFKKLDLIGVTFPRNKLNFSLPKILENFSKRDLVLLSKDACFDHFQEVASEDYEFKLGLDIFSIKIDKLADELLKNVGDLGNFIEKQKKIAIEKDDYRLYKVIDLVHDALLVYKEYSNIEDFFLIEIIKEIVKLNLPRLNVLTIQSDSACKILDIGNVSFEKYSKAPLVIASSSFGSLSSGNYKYSDKMIEGLKNIGPVKRGGLDFLFLKNDLVNLLKMNNAVLIYEDGLELEDQAFKEVLNSFNVKKIQLDYDFRLKETLDLLRSRVRGTFLSEKNSASKIQTFIDCKRKFYFTYVDLIAHTPDEKVSIAKRDLGVIEHKIIEEYFNICKELSQSFNLTVLRDLSRKLLIEFIKEKDQLISNQEFENALLEVQRLSQNGIEKILNVCSHLRNPKIRFEIPLEKNEFDIVGFVDCIITTEDYLAVFDFKRSTSAIGSKGDTKDFRKIQIWLYLLSFFRSEKYKKIEFGYLNLSEIESSLISVADGNEEVCKLYKVVHESFKAALEEHIAEMKKETIFPPNARNKNICDYCELNLVCIGKECENVE